MSEPSGESWERRAASLAAEVQRWLIRAGARSMRDEVGDQVRRVFTGTGTGTAPDEVWSAATTEPPEAAAEPPECAWCPVCRAARRLARASDRERAGAGGFGPGLSDAAELMGGAVREALAGIDAILSYRPPGTGEPADSDRPGGQNAGERPDEPDDRG
jgi:hypothetical protein